MNDTKAHIPYGIKVTNERRYERSNKVANIKKSPKDESFVSVSEGKIRSSSERSA